MYGEDGLVNIRRIMQILLDRKFQIGNEVITSTIHAVVQGEKGQWRCWTYRNKAENLLKLITPTKEYVLPNLLELDTTQTLGADDGRVREEAKRIVNGGIRHPTLVEPARFSTPLR